MDSGWGARPGSLGQAEAPRASCSVDTLGCELRRSLDMDRTGAQKGPQGGLRIEYDGARANGAAQQAVRTVPIDLALLREHWTVKAQPSADSKVGEAQPCAAPGLSAAQQSMAPGPIASSVVAPPPHSKPLAPLPGASHIHPLRLCRSVSVQELPHTESLAAETCVRAGVAAGKTDWRVRLGRRSATSSTYTDCSSHGPGSSPAPFLMVSGEPMVVGTAPSALGTTLSNASSPYVTAKSASNAMLGSSGAQRWTQSARNLFSALPGLCEVGLGEAAEAKQHGGRGGEPIEKRVWGGRLLRSQSKEAGTLMSMLSVLDSMGALPLTPRSEIDANTPLSGPVTGNGLNLSGGVAPATPPSASGLTSVSASLGGAATSAGAGSSSAVNIMELSRSSFGAAAVFGLNRLSSLDSCTLHQLDRALSSASLEAAAHAAAASVHAATVHAASAARAVQQAAAGRHTNGGMNGHAVTGNNGHAAQGCAASPTVGSSSSSVGLAASTPTRGVSLSSLSILNSLPAIHKVRPVGSVTSISLSLPAATAAGGGLSGAVAAGGGGGGPVSSSTMTRQDSTLFEFAEEQVSLAAAAVAAAHVGGSVSGGCGYYSSGLSGFVGSCGGAGTGASMYTHLTTAGGGKGQVGGMPTGASGGGDGGLSGPNDFLVLMSANSSHGASVSASPNNHQTAVSLAALLAANRSSGGGAAGLAVSPSGFATAGAAAAQSSFSSAAQLCGTPGAGSGPSCIRRFLDPNTGSAGITTTTTTTTTTVVSPRAVADRAAAAAAKSTAAPAAASPAAGSVGAYVPKIKTAAAAVVMPLSHGAPDMRAFAFSSPEDFFAAAAVLMDVQLPSGSSDSNNAAASAAALAADAAAGEDTRASHSATSTATLGTAATLTTLGSSSKGLFSAAGSSVSPTGGAQLAAEAEAAAEAECGADA